MTTSGYDYVGALEEFHSACGYSHNTTPSLSDEERIQLWTSLLREEVNELFQALSDRQLASVADGIGDCLYVLFGMSLAFDLPIEDIFQEIHQSNLSKIADGTNWRADGKVLRSGNYRPPNIEAVIERYRLSK